MLPPILEIYVVWHPGDEAGETIAEEFVEHFHGTVFSGLIGGAIEVYVRSVGWRDEGDAPRPIPLGENDLPKNIRPARFVAVVPLAGSELASAIQAGKGNWFECLEAIAADQKADSTRIGVFPCVLDGGAFDKTVLGDLIGHLQAIAAGTVRDGRDH